MEDQTIACPFCCNATFNSKESLIDHLSHTTENLVCPICKNSISSIDSLITHLKYDNCIETIMVCQYTLTENSLNKVEQTDVNLELETNENAHQNENSTENNSEDISEVSKIYSEFLNKHIDIKETQEIKLLKENGSRYLLVTNNEIAVTAGATLISKQNNDGTVSFSIQENTKVSENPDTVQVGIEAKTEDHQSQLGYEDNESVEEMYSCNTCGVSFTSVMEHIQNYHNDQDVVVEEPLDENNGAGDVEYETIPDQETGVVNQVSRRMITETGDIVEEPLKETEQNGQVRVIIPIKKDDDSKSQKSKHYLQVEKFCNSIVKDIKPVDESNGPYHKVVVKTMQAPNGNKVKVYNCMICNYLVSSLAEFQNHPCKNQKYNCVHCSVVYDNPKSLCAHMKVHKEKPVRFSCPLCPDVFDEPNNLCAHINEHKGNSDNIKLMDPVKFDCEICNTKFPTSKSLKLHKRMHYPIKSRPIEPPVETTEGSDKYPCPVCFKLIPVDYKTIHQNSHKASSKMICDICNKMFPTKEYLEMHMTVHNMDKVTVGKQDNTLPYQCLYCTRKFARPHEKVKHERIHTGEKPHSCEICGKSFRVSYCLTLHMRTHTGARPYECPHCPKRFKAHSVYNHHLLTHSDVRAYKCPYCPKSFKTSVQLAGHKNSHTKPFSCQQCNRPFASLYAVRVHMDVHTRQNNLKFSCGLCGASYARAFALKDHMRQAHNERPASPQLKETTWTKLKSSEIQETWTRMDSPEIQDTDDPLSRDVQSDIKDIEMNSAELIIS